MPVASSATSTTEFSSTTSSVGSEVADGAGDLAIYQSVDEILDVLDESAFACPRAVIYSIEQVLSTTPGVVAVADCEEWGTAHPDVTGYMALVFDSDAHRRLTVIGMLAWVCGEVPTASYVYGPNWLLAPQRDWSNHAAAGELAAATDGLAAAVDCAAFWEAPAGTSMDMNPAALDVAWYRAATGEIELPVLSVDQLPAVPDKPPSTFFDVAIPEAGLAMDGEFVGVGGDTRIRLILLDTDVIDVHTDPSRHLYQMVAVDGGFAAVGRSFGGNGGAITAYTSDGVTWEYTDLANGSSADSVAIGPRGLLAVGHDDGDPMMWQSDDGRSWEIYQPLEASGTPLQLLIGAEDRDQGIDHVAANETGYVVVNSAFGQAQAWYSEDLATWSNDHDFGGRVQVLTVHQGRFVALVDRSGARTVWTSDDGRAWREAPESAELDLGCCSLASNGQALLAVTSSETFTVSPDGADWTLLDTPVGLDDVQYPRVFGTENGWIMFAWIRGADAWGILTTTDGRLWQRVGTG